jgi:hypothetical protein
MGCKPTSTRVQNEKIDLKQEMTEIEKIDDVSDSITIYLNFRCSEHQSQFLKT